MRLYSHKRTAICSSKQSNSEKTDFTPNRLYSAGKALIRRILSGFSAFAESDRQYPLYDLIVQQAQNYCGCSGYGHGDQRRDGESLADTFERFDNRLMDDKYGDRSPAQI